MATEPFLGEIRIMSFGFPPKGWAQCNGQLLPINQNQALFSLIGTFYGGNGQSTFGLPDFRGRVGVSAGNGYIQGQMTGSATVSLLGSQIPPHIHTANGSSASTGGTPSAAVLPSTFVNAAAYTTNTGGLAAMGGGTIAVAGGGQPHENRQPSLVLNFCIAIQGIFPSRN